MDSKFLGSTTLGRIINTSDKTTPMVDILNQEFNTSLENLLTPNNNLNREGVNKENFSYNKTGSFTITKPTINFTELGIETLYNKKKKANKDNDLSIILVVHGGELVTNVDPSSARRVTGEDSGVKLLTDKLNTNVKLDKSYKNVTQFSQNIGRHINKNSTELFDLNSDTIRYYTNVGKNVRFNNNFWVLLFSIYYKRSFESLIILYLLVNFLFPSTEGDGDIYPYSRIKMEQVLRNNKRKFNQVSLDSPKIKLSIPNIEVSFGENDENKGESYVILMYTKKDSHSNIEYDFTKINLKELKAEKTRNSQINNLTAEQINNLTAEEYIYYLEKEDKLDLHKLLLWIEHLKIKTLEKQNVEIKNTYINYDIVYCQGDVIKGTNNHPGSTTFTPEIQKLLVANNNINQKQFFEKIFNLRSKVKETELNKRTNITCNIGEVLKNANNVNCNTSPNSNILKNSNKEKTFKQALCKLKKFEKNKLKGLYCREILKGGAKKTTDKKQTPKKTTDKKQTPKKTTDKKQTTKNTLNKTKDTVKKKNITTRSKIIK